MKNKLTLHVGIELCEWANRPGWANLTLTNKLTGRKILSPRAKRASPLTKTIYSFLHFSILN